MLRLPTRRLPSDLVHAYRNEIFEWLIEQDITPNDLSYLANGNTGDGPVVPVANDSTALCLLLQRPADVLRFHLAFGCRSLTPETLYDAVLAEASVHKFVFSDLARIAYDAIRSLVLRYTEPFAMWDDLEDDQRQFFLQLVREYLEVTSRSAEQMHDAWLDRRRLEGWNYMTEANFDDKRHPWMVPFNKLSERDQDKIHLITGVIQSLGRKL